MRQTRYASRVVPQHPGWTMRCGRTGAATVLLVTTAVEALDDLTMRVAERGYYAFASTPAAIVDLLSCARFDAVVVVGALEPEHVRQLSFAIRALPLPRRGSLLHLALHDDIAAGVESLVGTV